MPAPVSTNRRSLGAMEICISQHFVADGLNYKLQATRSRLEQNLPGGLAALHVGVCLPGVVERVDMLHAHLETPVGHPGQNLVGAPLEFLARGHVVPEGWPGYEERALAAELDEIERRYRAAGAAEESQQAARPKAVEAAVETGLADGVIDHVHTLVAGESLHLGDKVLLGVENYLGGPRLARKLSFLRSGDGGDDARADAGCHLRQQQPDTAGAGVHQRGVSGFERKG